MSKTHSYQIKLEWVGNRGTGTKTYRGYGRDHIISAEGKPDILGSADPAFLGTPSRWNPEEALLASVAACHKLWYLHLCFDAGVNVLSYVDNPTAEMRENPDGSGEFTHVMLRPEVQIDAGSDVEMATKLHGGVGDLCFIARSVKFPIHHSPVVTQRLN
ncbi:peroxiredoxin [Amylibacter marinus]|uniref:Peroxiredoxin n=1 Tax=Amylibacter marinus TaxID=1475483 RepID=A0ABQ5VV02_9RHOB|nr:OsmC family protein [Amylibacter marinus]GLQ35251.1 peroxiredoxin [Amylibacter marinus]